MSQVNVEIVDGPEPSRFGPVRAGIAPLAAALALVLAGCGDDEGSTTEATLSPEQEVEQIGNKWAPLFAAAPNPDACAGFDEQDPYREVAAKYMAQPACEQVVCARVPNRPIKNCTPPSSAFQESFADATVQDIAIKGNRAAAKFSNGVAVEFGGIGRPHDPVNELGPAWLIDKIGGNAGKKYFEP